MAAVAGGGFSSAFSALSLLSFSTSDGSTTGFSGSFLAATVSSSWPAVGMSKSFGTRRFLKIEGFKLGVWGLSELEHT